MAIKQLSTYLSFIICLTIGPNFCAYAEEANKTVWLVEAKRIQCVMNNLKSYQDSKNDPVIIYLDACPETNLAKALSKLSRNSAIPVITRKENVPGNLEHVIVYTKSELACLAGHKLDLSQDITTVPRKPCR